MVDLPDIRTGQKLRMAFEAPIGKDLSFDYICSFSKALDSSAFLVSIPMSGGQPIPLDEYRKLYLRIDEGARSVLITGYADDIVKEGIRRYWKIRRIEQHQIFKRTDERLKVTLHLSYMQDTWKMNSNGQIDAEPALSLDISNGGIAMYLSRSFEVGEVCRLNLPSLGADESDAAIDGLIGAVCWLREAPKGSPYRNICGLQFRFASAAEKEQLQHYTAAIKSHYAI